MSGYRVALWSLVIEAIGLAMLWFAPYEIVAPTGALVTGLGCALVFPGLGVEALKRVLPAIVAFLDIAYGISGPAAGVIAGQFGCAAVYLFGAACALFGAARSASPPAAFFLTINLDASGPGSDDATHGEIPSHASWFLDRPPVSA